MTLKHEDLELRKVPMAVSHIGVAAPPRVGDLVLVHFVNGDVNQPVVTGRFYHDGERPPLHQESEILFEHRLQDGTLNHLRFAADGSIYLQREVAKSEMAKDENAAKTSIKIDGATGSLECKIGENLSLIFTTDKDDSKDNIEIKAGDTQIQIIAKGVKIKDSKENLIEIKEDAFNITSKVPFTIDASGQPVKIKGDTIDFNKG